MLFVAKLGIFRNQKELYKSKSKSNFVNNVIIKPNHYPKGFPSCFLPIISRNVYKKLKYIVS